MPTSAPGPVPFMRRISADQLDSAAGPETFVVLEVAAREIASQNIASSLERLHALSDTAEAALRFQEKLFISVQGFDHDPRELVEIPEVRAFFTRLADAWPHWFWFLSRESGDISLLLALLCPVKVHRQAGQFGVEFVDQAALAAQINSLLSRGVALFEAFDISPAQAQASADSALRTMG